MDIVGLEDLLALHMPLDLILQGEVDLLHLLHQFLLLMLCTSTLQELGVCGRMVLLLQGHLVVDLLHLVDLLVLVFLPMYLRRTTSRPWAGSSTCRTLMRPTLSGTT